jgi:DNA-binding PadR family transcriptional regulator
MHKELHILGLLLVGPKTGYDLHRIVVAHGELFTDLKKGNVYYLLDRLAQHGALSVTTEAGARGPQRERYLYAITEQGRRRFDHLLREVVRTFEVAHTGVEVGVVFLPYLERRDAIQLLQERREAALARRAEIAGEGHTHDGLYQALARDHLLSLLDAELAWIDRALRRLGEDGAGEESAHEATEARCRGMGGGE